MPPVAAAPPPLTEPTISTPAYRKVLQASEELLTVGGVPRDPSRQLSDQVLDLMQEGKLALPEMELLLKDAGLSFTDFAEQLFRGGVRDAARRLSYLSRLEAKVRQWGAPSPEATAELAALKQVAGEADESVKALSWWKRADNIRRGLLVTQLATAVRNAETQAGRVGVDVLQQALEAGMTPAAGKADQLFTAAESVVSVLNTANRGQEFLFRRAVFMTKLEQQLRRKGLDLEDIVANNRVGAIPEGDIKAAVNQALEFTMAESPKFGTVAQKFVSVINAMPGATLPIPFPRFMVNALKFNFEFSPLGFLKLLSPQQRAAIAQGNTQVLSRAVLGTAMLGAAYEFRNSEFAGEKWYEARLPDGRSVDLRPFNPFAAYIFVADVAKRGLEGRLDTFTTRDIAMGLLGMNLRAGTGLYAMDRILPGLVGAGSAEKALNLVKGVAGETAAGFLVPLQQVTDVLAQFDSTYGTSRSQRQEPFLGPIKARIPGLAHTLPESRSPTREEPLLRQLTGVTVISAKNPAERELDRLGFEFRELLPGTGNPEAKQVLARHMGPLVERVLSRVVEAPDYQGLSDGQKAMQLEGVLRRLREVVGRVARQERPDLFTPLALERKFSPRQRRALEEMGLPLMKGTPLLQPPVLEGAR